jgi:hypothetical protein
MRGKREGYEFSGKSFEWEAEIQTTRHVALSVKCP